LRSVKECIEQDPALTVKILRTVNSSLFGLSHEVSDLNQAIALLGTTPLKMLVLGFSLPPNLFRDIDDDILGQYWQHTLTKAVAAKTLARFAIKIAPDEAYICGLLQDLGQLVLIQQLGESYTNFLERARTGSCKLAEMETATLGFDHASLTARLLDHWGFPPRLVRAIGCPQEAAAIFELPAGERELPQVLHLAELLTQFLTTSRHTTLQELQYHGQKYCRLSETTLRDTTKQLAAQVPQLAAAYSQQVDIEFETILETAYVQLVRVAEDVVPSLVPNEATRPESPTSPIERVELNLAGLDQLGFDDQALQETGDHTPPSTPLVSPLQLSTQQPLPQQPLLQHPLSQPQTPQRIEQPGVAEPCDLEEQVGSAVRKCRQSRIPLSFMLIEIAQSEQQIFQMGPPAFQATMDELKEVIVRLTEVTNVIRSGDAQFAVLLSDFERSEAVSMARGVLQNILQTLRDSNRPEVPLGVGVSTLSCPPANFPAADMIKAAERCLYGAHQCGGGIVKSIDL